MGMFVGDAIENLERPFASAGEKQSMAVASFGQMVEITLANAGNESCQSIATDERFRRRPANTDAMK